MKKNGKKLVFNLGSFSTNPVMHINSICFVVVMESISVLKKKHGKEKTQEEILAKIVSGLEDIKAGRVKEWKRAKK